MDEIEKECFKLWLKNGETWDSYLKSRQVEKIVRNKVKLDNNRDMKKKMSKYTIYDVTLAFILGLFVAGGIWFVII